MTDLFSVALDVQQFFEARKWPFCIIGGVAVLHWGEPRVTRDVDFTLLTGFGSEEAFAEELLGNFQPRLANALEFAIRNRVLLLQSSGGIGIDIAFGALPFEESAIHRAKKTQITAEAQLRICSAEDLIVFKSFAGREVDWRDVQAIIARQGAAKLDWKYIEKQLTPLAEAKEQPELLDQLRRLRWQR
jgi:hypothetical protein